jgi:hypothetical protein
MDYTGCAAWIILVRAYTFGVLQRTKTRNGISSGKAHTD